MNIYWMKYSPLESNISATDPLALDYMAQQLGYLPLPNFTGRTSRARYYSMVCYGLYICEQIIIRDKLLFNDQTVVKLFELYEKYWAYAVVYSYNGGIRERDYNESGLRGKRGAIKALSNNIRSLGDEYKLISRQLELGGLGAYRSSLERFHLIKQSSLSLTMRGREMAESFLPVDIKMRKQYDELIIESILSKKIIEKKGRASIGMFGQYASLDLYKDTNKDSNERIALRKQIIESHGITLATAKMVCVNREIFEKSILDGLAELSFYPTSDMAEVYVRDSIKTIYCFELLSIELNNAFCTILQAAYENGGKILMKELENYVEPFVNNLQSKNLAGNLSESPKYYELSSLFYGGEFLEIISFLRSNISYEQFIGAILKLHGAVETKRKSGRWVEMEGDSLAAYSGYEYAKANMNRQHNYKIPNLLSIVDDAGWRV